MCLPSLRSVEAVSAFSAVHHAFPNLFGHRTHYPSHTIHRMGDMQSQVASAVGVIQSGLHVCFVSKSTGSTGAFEFSQSWDTCPSRQQTVGRGIPAPQGNRQLVGDTWPLKATDSRSWDTCMPLKATDCRLWDTCPLKATDSRSWDTWPLKATDSRSWDAWPLKATDSRSWDTEKSQK